MLIDLANLSASRVYHTMIQTIIPRPIAWVLSDNGDGGYNLAPFSYFNGICSDPPLILLSIGKKPEGVIKDSRRNIAERERFVVHIAHRDLVEEVNASSAVLAHGESELERQRLAVTEFEGFELPRLAGCRVAMACELYRLDEIGAQALIFGRVRHMYLSDDIVTVGEKDRLHIDARALDPIARLGGEDFATLGEIITVPRPR